MTKCKKPIVDGIVLKSGHKYLRYYICKNCGRIHIYKKVLDNEEYQRRNKKC